MAALVGMAASAGMAAEDTAKSPDKSTRMIRFLGLIPNDTRPPRTASFDEPLVGPEGGQTAAMSELTTGHELLLYGALIIVTIFTLDRRESRFGAGNGRRAPKRMPTERNDERDQRS